MSSWDRPFDSNAASAPLVVQFAPPPSFDSVVSPPPALASDFDGSAAMSSETPSRGDAERTNVDACTAVHEHVQVEIVASPVAIQPGVGEQRIKRIYVASHCGVVSKIVFSLQDDSVVRMQARFRDSDIDHSYTHPDMWWWDVPDGEVIVRAIFGKPNTFPLPTTSFWAFQTDRGTMSPYFDGNARQHVDIGPRDPAPEYWLGQKEWLVFEGGMDVLQRQLEPIMCSLHDEAEAQSPNLLCFSQPDADNMSQRDFSLTDVFTYNAHCQDKKQMLMMSYVPVFACIALMIWICCAAAYSMPKTKALGLILGLFLPCGCLAFVAGTKCINSHNFSTFCCLVFGVSSYVGAFIGLLGAYIWLVPWWTLSHQGTLFNVNATGAEWLATNAAPTAGMYHFDTGAFVLQQKYGFASSTTSGTEDKFYCAAPIVASSHQARTVFWVTAFGCCDATSSSCWNAYTLPGSVKGAYLLTRYASDIVVELKDARTVASTKLAVNSTYTYAQLNALPLVYVELSSEPESQRDLFYTKGMLWSVLMTLFWPVTAAVLVGMAHAFVSGALFG